MRPRSIVRPLAVISILVASVAATASSAAARHQPAAPPGCDPADPAACLLPFPNDWFTVRDPRTDTGRRVAFGTDAMPRNTLGRHIDPSAWNRNDGFSPGSMVLTHVPGLDLVRTGAAPVTDMARSLDPGAPILLIDTRTGERHPYWAELDSNATDPARRALIVRPARNLREGVRYLVVLRNLRDATGDVIAPNATFAALMSPRPPADPALRLRWLHVQAALAGMRRFGVDAGGLYLTWDFTVASRRNLSERMLHMRETAFGQLGGRPPTFVIESTTDFTPEQDPRIARQVRGSVVAPSYLNAPFGPPGSRFNLDARGLPQPLPFNVQLALHL